jgi:hypothetical protein
MDRKPKRPRDPAQLAKLVVDIATGEVEDAEPERPLTDAQRFARQGGAKGGRARAEKLAPDERSRIARKAAAARWHKE